MKEAYYFSHDSNAHRHAKILALRMTHGWGGYGLFWAIIEKLRECHNYQHEADYNLLAYDLRTDAKIIKSILEDYGLFEFTDINGQKFFYSERLSESMQTREEILAKRSEAGKKGRAKQLEQHAKTQEIADGGQTLGNYQANANDCPSNKRKEKERKENTSSLRSEESIGAKRTAFVPPSLQQVQAYISEKGYAIDAEHFIDFYTSKGWMVGKNKMKDWKAAVRTWSRKDFNPQSHHDTNSANASHRRQGHLLATDEAKAYDTTF